MSVLNVTQPVRTGTGDHTYNASCCFVIIESLKMINIIHLSNNARLSDTVVGHVITKLKKGLRFVSLLIFNLVFCAFLFGESHPRGSRNGVRLTLIAGNLGMCPATVVANVEKVAFVPCKLS